ncbi:MAG: hypothetical protein IJA60_01450 [Clostridia bacterium]|nr:hypothetical protein [Clostridia bacterium]
MRGCERKIIMLKGTNSEIFDEAYFLLRRDFKNRGNDEEIVREAQRIVDKNTTHRRRRKLDVHDTATFSAGIVAGAALAAILMIIF